MHEDVGALPHQRAAFRVPDGVAYFDTANLSPQLHAVHAAGQRALDKRGRPWTITGADWFTDAERLRGLLGALIGSDAESIALVPATSYGFAVAAHNIRLGRGDRVLVLAGEYPSGVYTWRASAREVGAELLTVHRESGQNWTDAVLAALDERVRVVSVPNVHWTDGALVDLVAVGDHARQVGAHLVVDGSQSVGAMPLDVAAVQPDFLVTVGYKWLLGPFGVGYLYVAERHRDGRPIEQNWILRENSEDFAGLVNYRDEYQPGARRYDVGERSKFELLPMAVAALEQLTRWGVPAVAASLDRLNGTIAHRVSELGMHPVPREQRGPHLLGIDLPVELRRTIRATLGRAGCHASVRGTALRLAPHLHITPGDTERLLAALAVSYDDRSSGGAT